MRQIAGGLLAALLVATTAAAEEPRRGPSFLTQARAAAATLALAGAPAMQTADDAEPPVTITGAIDFPSTYFFRGIRQEADPAFTMQPGVNVAFAAAEGVTLNVGSWNSIHTGSTKDGPGAFYESDFYASAALSAGAISPTVTYTAYMSPADAFSTVHELSFTAAFDDSEAGFPLAPAVTLAFELGDHSADGGSRKGVYLELAATPAIPLADDAPLTLTVPVRLGLSAHNYYENPVTGDDETFGYFSVGLMGLVPLSANLDLHGGVTVFTFGDTLELFNNGDKAQVIGSVGLGFSF